MKVTLDHNCLINLANNTDVGQKVKAIIESETNECFIVNIGASEMRERGILPDRYDQFENFLSEIGLSHLERINPIGIFDVTFFDYCVYASEDDSELINKIKMILFPNELEGNISEEGLDSEFGRKWLNRLCDIHSMWCHINSGNDIFLTADKNFSKKTKKPQLINLGAKDIMHPNDVSI